MAGCSTKTEITRSVARVFFNASKTDFISVRPIKGARRDHVNGINSISFTRGDEKLTIPKTICLEFAAQIITIPASDRIGQFKFQDETYGCSFHCNLNKNTISLTSRRLNGTKNVRIEEIKIPAKHGQAFFEVLIDVCEKKLDLVDDLVCETCGNKS